MPHNTPVHGPNRGIGVHAVCPRLYSPAHSSFHAETKHQEGMQ